MNRLLISAIVLLFVGCQGKTTKKSADAPAPAGNMESYTPSDEEKARILENVQKGLIGDSTMFPYVYQGEGRDLIYQAYSLSFTLTTPNAMGAMMNDKVAWVKPEANNITNGIFATYIRNGREISLDNPYIQVQYINKTLPYCSTLDSTFLWLDNAFLKSPTASILQKRTDLQTASGIPAFYKVYTTGQSESPGVRTKWIANAYIDATDEYMVAFGLTTMDEGDFELTKPLFDELVKSYREY